MVAGVDGTGTDGGTVPERGGGLGRPANGTGNGPAIILPPENPAA